MIITKVEGRLILLIFFISFFDYDFHKMMLQGTTKGLFSSSKVSRISLIDLAGVDSHEVGDVGSQCTRENRHVEKSLSQLE